MERVSLMGAPVDTREELRRFREKSRKGAAYGLWWGARRHRGAGVQPDDAGQGAQRDLAIGIIEMAAILVGQGKIAVIAQPRGGDGVARLQAKPQSLRLRGGLQSAF